GDTVANVSPGSQQLELPFRGRGALRLSAASVTGEESPAAVSARATRVDTSERITLAVGDVTSLAPGTYQIEASATVAGQAAQAFGVVTVELGELGDETLTFFTAASKCSASDDSIREADPACRDVGVTVEGLEDGSSLSVQLNGAESLTLNSNGRAVFGTQLPEGTSYVVVVTGQPGSPRQLCVPSGLGAVAADEVVIRCGLPFVQLSVEVFGDLGEGPLVSVIPLDEGPSLGTFRIQSEGTTVTLPLELPVGSQVEVLIDDISSIDAENVSCTPVGATSVTAGTVDPPAIQFVCLAAPRALYDSRFLGDWLQADGASVFDASGAPCDPGSISQREQCFDGSMVRELILPGEVFESCDGILDIQWSAPTELSWLCDRTG
ncbi:MAG: hypothetical protein AAFY60_19865, partial [Myxococcota bacterium]